MENTETREHRDDIRIEGVRVCRDCRQKKHRKRPKVCPGKRDTSGFTLEAVFEIINKIPDDFRPLRDVLRASMLEFDPMLASTVQADKRVLDGNVFDEARKFAARAFWHGVSLDDMDVLEKLQVVIDNVEHQQGLRISKTANGYTVYTGAKTYFTDPKLVSAVGRAFEEARNPCPNCSRRDYRRLFGEYTDTFHATACDLCVDEE